MRWNATLWVTVAAAAVTGALHLTIDNTIDRNIIVSTVHTDAPPVVDVTPNDIAHREVGDTDETSSDSEGDPSAQQSSDASEAGDTNENINSEEVDNAAPIPESGVNESITSEEVSISDDDEALPPPIPESGANFKSSESSGQNHLGELLDLEEGDVISTEHGDVQGYYIHPSSRIQSFLDIPYGSITGLFSPPEEPKERAEVLRVGEHAKRCPQLQDGALVGDVDCLTLSVFVPENAKNAKVLFHIHDGNFVSGSGDPTIYGPEYLAAKDVILVLPNYRLGILGFLCLHNDAAPGNAALKDLTLALKWTKENIENFGGDPDDITVSGDGTAGALVGYLALSSKSRGYISRIIIESGSTLAHWALNRDPVTTAAATARKIATATSDPLDAYKTVDVQTVVLAATDIQFKPCVESKSTESFLDETPWSILQNNETSIEIDIMIGSAEYAGMHEALSHSTESLSQLNANFHNFLPNDLKFEDTRERNEVADDVKKQYFGELTVNRQTLDRLARCYTDASYLGPLVRTARAFVDRGAKVYLYEFSFVGEFNRESHALGDAVDGAARGDLVGYVFTQDGQMPEEDSPEKRVVNEVVTAWVTFMQTGIPSIGEDLDWKELGDDEEHYLSIGPELKPGTGLHVTRMQFWTDIYDKHFIEHNSATQLRSLIILSVTITILAITNKFESV